MKRITRRRLYVDLLEARRLLAVYSPAADAVDGAADSFRAALVNSQANNEDDTIELSAGVYRLYAGDLLVDEVDSMLSIVGAGSDQTFISIEGEARFLDVDFDAVVELRGVTVLGGSADEGGQIRSAGDVTIRDTRLQRGFGRQGGSILNAGNLVLENVNLSQNMAGWGGAIWNHAGGVVDAVGVEFAWNRTDLSEYSVEPEGRPSFESLGLSVNMPEGTSNSGDIPEIFLEGVLLPSGNVLFNGGEFRGSQIEITGSQDGFSAVENYGDDAVLELDQLSAHHNHTAVLANSFGRAQLTGSWLFENQRSASGLVSNRFGVLDVQATSIFDNTSSSWSTSAIHSVEAITRLTDVVVTGNQAGSADSFYRISSYEPQFLRTSAVGINQSAYSGFLELTNVTVDNNSVSVRYILEYIDKEPGYPKILEPVFSTVFHPANLTVFGEYQSGGGNRVGPEVWLKYAEDVSPPLAEETPKDVFLTTGTHGSPHPSFHIYTATLYDGPLPEKTPIDFVFAEDSADNDLSIDSPQTVPTASRGEVSMDGSGNRIYQPPSDWFGTDVVSFVSRDGRLTVLTVDVPNLPDPPVAADDEFVVLGRTEWPGLEFGLRPERVTDRDRDDLSDLGLDVDRWLVPTDHNLPKTKITPLNGDTTGPDGGLLRLLEFTQPAHGKVGRTGPEANTLDFLPDAGFSGIDSFTYTITNDSGGTSQATVTLNVLNTAELPPLGEIRASFVDADSNPIERVREGEEFFVDLDIRRLSALGHPVGSFASGFSTVAAGVRIEGDSISSAGSAYTRGRFNVEYENRLSEWSDSLVEAIVHATTFDGPGDGDFYRIPIVSHELGDVTVTLDPTLLTLNYISFPGYGYLPFDAIRYVGDSIEVVSDHTNVGDPEDVNEDTNVTAVDALIVINALARKGGQQEGDAAATRATDDHMWDVDGNGELTALDALRVINRIGRELKSTGAALVPDGESLDDDDERLNQSAPVSTISVEPVDRVMTDWSNEPSAASSTTDEPSPVAAGEQPDDQSAPLDPSIASLRLMVF